MKLLCSHYDFSVPLRSLGVGACDLVDLSAGVQLTFDKDSVRQDNLERLGNCVDALRNRFGRDCIKRAVLVGANIVGESDPLTHDIHPTIFSR
jgi:DNA polymerase IV